MPKGIDPHVSPSGFLRMTGKLKITKKAQK